MILSAFFRALGQMGDLRFLQVLFLGLGLTVALFLAVYWLFVGAIGWFVGDALVIPWIGTVAWVDEALSWAAIPLMLVLSVFLMVPVASAFTSLFLDQVADAVEARHYPHLPPADDVSLADSLRDTVGFLGVLIVANILAFVLYLFFVPLAPFIFWALNGFLLGREYYTLAAMRRVGRAEARRLRGRHLPTIWLAGVLMAVPLTVPVLNLLVPILGAATFTHLYHRIEGRRA